jgi:hypothetical protein
MEVEMEAPAPQDPAAQQPEGFDLEVRLTHLLLCIAVARIGGADWRRLGRRTVLLPHLVAADVQAYIAAYSGHARIKRLLFIAERNAGKPLELDALQLAADALRQASRAL